MIDHQEWRRRCRIRRKTSREVSTGVSKASLPPLLGGGGHGAGWAGFGGARGPLQAAQGPPWAASLIPPLSSVPSAGSSSLKVGRLEPLLSSFAPHPSDGACAVALRHMVAYGTACFHRRRVGAGGARYFPGKGLAGKKGEKETPSPKDLSVAIGPREPKGSNRAVIPTPPGGGGR